MDLMDMVKGAVSKQIMGQIGGLLGTDEKKTSSVFETAAGSILGGLIKKAGSGDGAKQVFDMASKQDSSVLDKLGDILGGGEKSVNDLQKSGGGILDGIFGSNQTSMLGTLAKFLGLKDNMMGTLLKLVAPIIMGVIGKHIKSKALDAVGLGSFLGEQKKSLSFMPPALADGLGFGNMLGNVGDAGKAALGNVQNAAGNASKAAQGAANDAAAAGGGLLKLLVPLLIVGALAFGAYKYLMPMINSGKDAVKNAASGMADGFEIPSIPGMDANFSTGLKDITAGFEGLKDSGEDGATNLANKITGFTGALDNMGLANLPDAGKETAKGVVGKFIEKITGLLGGQTDGIKGILEPVVNALKEKLAGVFG